MKILFTLFTLFLLAACSSKSTLDDFRKLDGTWVEEGDMTFTEVWKWENDHLRSGIGKMTIGKETTFSEKLQ